MRGILTWIGINFVITFVFVNAISWEGHLGGFVGGTAIGAVLVYAPRGPRRTAIQVAGLTAIAALIVASPSWSAPPRSPDLVHIPQQGNDNGVVLHRFVHTCGNADPSSDATARADVELTSSNDGST